MSRGRHFVRPRGKSLCMCQGQKAEAGEAKDAGAGVCLVRGAGPLRAATGGWNGKD